MPNISVLKSSKFLTRGDVGLGVLLTIKDCVEINVAKEGAPEEYRWCLLFVETEKPCVLNSTNGQIIAGFIGKDDTEAWPGHKVVLYDDPNVSFGGKLVGGIRARAPRTPQGKPGPTVATTVILPTSQHPPAKQPPAWPTTPTPTPSPALPAAAEEEDSVPF